MEPSIEILLGEDHLAIDGLYDKFLEAKRGSSERAVEAFRKYKVALLRHIKCEEDLIFPVLKSFPAEPAYEEVFTLREEHQIIIPLLMEVEKNLKQGSDSSHSELRLFEGLHEHNAREEMRFYGSLDRLLSESEKHVVIEGIQARG